MSILSDADAHELIGVVQSLPASQLGALAMATGLSFNVLVSMHSHATQAAAKQEVVDLRRAAHALTSLLAAPLRASDGLALLRAARDRGCAPSALARVLYEKGAFAEAEAEGQRKYGVSATSNDVFSLLTVRDVALYLSLSCVVVYVCVFYLIFPLLCVAVTPSSPRAPRPSLSPTRLSLCSCP